MRSRCWIPPSHVAVQVVQSVQSSTLQGSGQHGRGPQLRVSDVSSHLSGQSFVTSRLRVSFPLIPHVWLQPSQSFQSAYSHLQGGGGQGGFGSGHGSVCGSVQLRPPQLGSVWSSRMRVLECPGPDKQGFGQVDQSLHGPSWQSSGQQVSSSQGTFSVSSFLSQSLISLRERDFVPFSHDLLQGLHSPHSSHLQHSGGVGIGPEQVASSGVGHGAPPYFASTVTMHSLVFSPLPQDVLHELHSFHSHLQGMGHSSFTHGFSCSLSPSHSFPPYFASCSTSRLRERVPVPHDTVQPVQSDQSDHLQGGHVRLRSHSCVSDRSPHASPPQSGS